MSDKDRQKGGWFGRGRDEVPDPQAQMLTFGVPPTPEQRKAFTHNIFELGSPSSADIAIIQGTVDALWDVAIPLVAISDGTKITVLSKEKDDKDRVLESVLILGTSDAIRRKIMERPTQPKDPQTYKDEAKKIGTEMLIDFVQRKNDPIIRTSEIYDVFAEYYKGLRWHTDQEKLVNELFASGTDFDPEFLQRHLDTNDIGTLTYIMGLDIDYKVRRDWDKKTPEQVFKQFPQLDYHRLQNQAFRDSVEGQELIRGYARLSGNMLANYYRHGYERLTTEDGAEIPVPRIPLSKFPIIEALMVNELAGDKPKQKYSFGPKNLVDLAFNSDSKPMHDAVVASITTRLQEKPGMMFDGPDEFSHKHGNIMDLLALYKKASNDPKRRELLRADLLKVMDAFTGEGSIAASVRTENLAYRMRSRRWNDGESDSTELYKLREIVKDLLTIGVVAVDPDVQEKAIRIMEDEMRALQKNAARSEFENVNLPQEGIGLTREDLMVVLLDGIKEVSKGTNIQLIEKLGTLLFQSKDLGKELADIAAKRIKARELRNTREVIMAQRGLRRFSLSLGDKKSEEEIQARKAFDDAVRPSDTLYEEQRKRLNQLILGQLHVLAESGKLTNDNASIKLFTELVKRVIFHDYKMKVLPEEYTQLIALAKNPNLSGRQRNDILWHVGQQFDYLQSESKYLMVPVVLDMYEVALGPVENVGMPDDSTDHGLSAAAHVVRENGNAIFKSATPEQLGKLDAYKLAMIEIAKRTGALLTNGELVETAALEAWQRNALKNIKDVVRVMQGIEEHYEEYIHMEDVKLYPNKYYPWVLNQLAPFWQKMQWEVGPGNSPKPDIRRLYNTLKDSIRNKLVIKEGEYPENFDVIKEGHLDELLVACYEQMVVPHDIKYNGTVWREGLDFVRQAIMYMPEVVLKQMLAEHEGTSFANYLEREYNRWHEEKEVF